MDPGSDSLQLPQLSLGQLQDAEVLRWEPRVLGEQGSPEDPSSSSRTADDTVVVEMRRRFPEDELARLRLARRDMVGGLGWERHSRWVVVDGPAALRNHVVQRVGQSSSERTLASA